MASERVAPGTSCWQAWYPLGQCKGRHPAKPLTWRMAMPPIQKLELVSADPLKTSMWRDGASVNKGPAPALASARVCVGDHRLLSLKRHLVQTRRDVAFPLQSVVLLLAAFGDL